MDRIGYDGTKRKNGSKLHMMVDIPGHLRTQLEELTQRKILEAKLYATCARLEADAREQAASARPDRGLR
ncbi:hypothetical protein AA18889_1458 [Acetobacter senegalensis DSM 18889]|nr:hypothetical protein AA18889_1458 [Acetobacter senegalensis DSM 18889]